MTTARGAQAEIVWRSESKTIAGTGRRDFELLVDSDRVAGRAWLPLHATPPMPLVLVGHGFGLDRRNPFPLEWVSRLAAQGGCAVACLDARLHGERRPPGVSTPQEHHPYWVADWSSGGDRAAARELSCAADALRRTQEIGNGPLGYWGLSLGTQYGLPFLAGSRHVAGAVLGLFRNGPRVAHYARRVACPVFFVRQLDDELHPAGLVAELFDNVAAEDKQLASSPGAHTAVPEAVCQAALDFLIDRLHAV